MTDRSKLLAKLAKMQAARDGEASLGNTEAAEAFAGAINRMLLEHELSESDVDHARMADQDPVVQMLVNFGAYQIDQKKSRVAWQESLARIVAKAHLCSFLVQKGSNRIWFVGTKTHATVAEYAFGTLVPAADKMATTARNRFDYECRVLGNEYGKDGARGFREAWLAAFIQRIDERFTEARKAAVAEAPEASTALVRLNQALVKTQEYMERTFKDKKTIPGLGLEARHGEGWRQGRAAADRIRIGQRGVEASPRKDLTSLKA